MDKMTDKILNLITETLPDAHVGVLREYLQTAAKNEKELADTKSSLEIRRKDLEARQADLAKLKEEFKRITEEVEKLKIEAEQVRKDKYEIELIKTRKDFECSQRERDTLIRLNEIVFRNPRFVHVIERHESISEKEKDQIAYGCMYQTKTRDEQVTTRVTEE